MPIEYPTLSKFNEDCAAIGKSLDERQALLARITRLEADLLECREYLEDEMDVIDGSDGSPMPNRAMALVNMIDETLHGAGF